MHTLKKRSYFFVVSLSALAGYVDVVGFLHLGGYFISFMSGNSTRLAVNLTNGDTSGIILLAKIIALFIAGSMIGVFIRHFSKEEMAVAHVLTFVAVMLVSAAFAYESGWVFLPISLMVLAMGAENAIFQRNGEMIVGLTYMTGALVKMGQRLAYAMLGGPKLAWLPYFILWLGLIMGGMLGVVMFDLCGLRSLWVAALWAATITAIVHPLKHWF